MKRLLTILFFFTSLSASANNIFVSTIGNDLTGNGTIGNPYKTWQKGWSALANAGDTLYIRGGTYTSPFAIGVSDWLVTFASKSGTPANHIVVSAYQNEQPVLDLNGFRQTNNTTALRINECAWIDIYGLKIQNLLQNGANIIAGIDVHACLNMKFERVWVHNIGGAGFRQSLINGSDTRKNNNFTYVNCDASWCGDSVSTGGGSYGNADGFDADEGNATYTGCRAWWNSDDGFDFSFNDSTVNSANCQSFRNGYVPGTFTNPGAQADGMGFKWAIGSQADQSTVIRRTFTNCISFDNKAAAYDQNQGKVKAVFYNCDAYRCPNGWQTGWGIVPRVAHILKNNISYLCTNIITDSAGMVMSNNSWEVATPAPASFSSLDTNGISGVRQPNGNLTNTGFLNLSPSSNQIDKGVDVGLPFCGQFPDLGAYELCAAFASNVYYVAANGSDAFTSTQAHNPATPWQTTSKINSFMASLNPGDTVKFRRGDTFPGFLICTKAGTAANRIVFTSYGSGAKPIITGLTQVTSWTNTGGNIWQSTNAVSPLTYTNVVTVNGVATAMGRTPNSGTYLTIASHTGHTQAVISSLTGSPNYTNAQLVARTTGNSYIFSVNNISSQTTSTLNTFPAYPNPFGFTVYDYANGQAFIQNAISTLDVTNEWYFDKSTKKLSIVSSGTPSAVSIATVDSLVRITAGFITFDNLDFRGANTDCFQLLTASTVTIQNCDIRYCGDMGVQQQDNSPNLSILNCTFRDIYNSGITNIGYGGNTNQNITGNSLVNINMIPGAWGSLDGTNLGIAMYNPTSGDSIRNNSLDSTGYSGIFEVGQNYKVRNNFINHFCFWNSDGGGIYTGRNGAGRFIIGNIVINGMTPQAMGIYGDENTSGVTIQNNSTASCVLGIYLHNGHDCTVRGNTTFQSSTASLNMTHDVGQDLIRNVTIAKNIFVQTATTTQANVSYQDQPEATPITDFGVSDSNNISRPVGTDDNAWFTVKAGPVFTHYTLAAWQAASAYDLHSTRSPLQVTLANIRFVYNASNSVSVQSLGANYLQILAPPNTTAQWNGSITLFPWTSAVLLLNATGPPPLTASATVGQNPLLCFGGNTSITLNATGGVSPYQYRVGAGTFGSNNVFSVLVAGTYAFQVRDNAGTIFSINVTITQPTQMTITQSSTPILINGNSSTTTVTVSGGTVGTGYRYSLDGGINQPSNIFTGVLAGPHTITVTDGNGCTNILAYTLTQPTALVITASASPNPLLCANGLATITATASGATPPYQYSINGGAFQSPNTFTGLVAGTYTITAKDAAGATKTTTVTITAPTALTLSEGHTAILVNGGNSTVTFTAGGGTPAYTYSINGGTTFQSSNVFAGIVAGTYNGVVKDSHGCTTPITFTITQPSSLSGSAVVGTILCFNGNAQMTITATGGTPAYQYSINGGVSFQVSNIFTVTAATYNVTIKDAGGALFSFSQAVTQPTQITISESHTPILINGNNSTLTITASGATPGYTYSIDGVTFQPSNVFSVPAGTYTVTVKDANNCTNTFVVTITQPSSLTLAVVTTVIPCSGGGSTATATASGGTGPYQYKIGTGSFQPGNTFTNLAAGTYLFTVKDAGGAITTTNKTITQPAPITMSLAYSDAPTNVVVTPSGGVAPYMYRLDGSALQPSNTFTNVSAGNHTSIVVDANGCIGQQQFTVNNLVFIGVSFPPILCNGGSTPVTITPSGGVPPYTITGGSPQTKTAGNYTFTVTDSRGSIAQFTTTIPEPAPMTIGESHTPILINGNTSNITFSVSGGTPAYTYSLDGVTFQSSNVFNNKLAGNYTVTVKDANNCINTFSFTITQPGALSVIATPGTILCPGGNTSVTLTASSGTPPYLYRINSQPLQVSNVFTGILAGTYTFTAQDNFGAIAQVIATISQPPALTVSVVTGTILVNGGNTSATGTGNGGTAPYTYSIDGGPFQGSGTFTGVLAGPHTITVKDANNCTNFNTFTITQPGVLGLSVVLGTITCNGGGATVSTITGSGGTTPYTYNVDGGAYSGVNTFTGLLAGQHTFSIKDAFGSIAQSLQTISQPTAIVLSVTTGTIIVSGGSTSVNASATGGGGGIQYSLDGGAYQVSGTFTGVLAGPHTVTAKDVSNCTTINSFSISQPGVLRATVTFGQNPLLCYGITTPMTITPSGGTPPYTITGGSPQIVPAGTYTVHIVDAFNVPFDTIVTLVQPPLTVLVQVIQYPNPILVYGGTADSVWISSAGGVPISGSFYNYALDGGAFNLSDSAFKYKFVGVTGGNHTVTIRDSHGCAETYPFFVNQPPPPVQKQTHSWDRRRVYKNQ